MMQLSQVSNAVSGQMFGADMGLNGVTINSREDCTNKLFIALVGDRFDSHDFLEQAKQQGSTAAIVERKSAIEKTQPDLPFVLVKNSHQALTSLASWWRDQFEIPVIGITGSVGKTSVKEMLGAIFAVTGRGLVTQGNLNNEIGVPLTLLRLAEDDTYAIVEMGMNHAGEISRLTKITKPTIALINNAAAAHLEGLGSVQAVAEAKAEIFEGLSLDGIAVINADDKYASLWLDVIGARGCVTFGVDSQADITASYQLTTTGLSMQVKAFDEVFEISLPLIGKHNVMNILASIAVAFASNISIKSIITGLENYQPAAGRLNVSKVGSITLIDDSYNANPASMRAAIEVLGQFSDSTLIVGDMGELGSDSELEHKKLGEIATECGIHKVIAVGRYASLVVEKFNNESSVFSKQSQLIDYLTEHPITKGAVLVKGSRSTKMENIVECLMKYHGDHIILDDGSQRRMG